MYTVKIEGVSKSYRKFQALHNIDLQIEKGLYGLLGPNGAGKTTLMKILRTILFVTHDQAVADQCDRISHIVFIGKKQFFCLRP